MAFANLLREWKSETGWTESDIGKSVGVSRAAVNQWLNEAAKPSLEQLPALGKLLKRDWRELASMILGEPAKGKEQPMRPDIAALLSRAETLTPEELDRLYRVLLAMYPDTRK